MDISVHLTPKKALAKILMVDRQGRTHKASIDS